jgi:histone H3/H4
MDDFNVSSLHESKNEYSARLLTTLTPCIIDGLKSIFDESYKLCKENGELDKYLMTFQNLIARIPKWNANIIEQERKRIIEKSGCSYLEELVTCVHIIQLKLLTAMRVGQKQKKIDINIPKLDDFIHKTYITVARKIYKNVYLFELNVVPLQIQKNNRELEIIVQECILNSVRESIPVEHILRAYMDETVEEDVIEEIKEQIIEPQEEVKSESVQITEIKNDITTETEDNTKLKFNDVDTVLNKHGKEELVNAPKTIERLEEISNLRNIQRKMEESNDDDEKLNISNDDIPLDNLDVHILNPLEMKLKDDLFLDDIEILA